MTRSHVLSLTSLPRGWSSYLLPTPFIAFSFVPPHSATTPSCSHYSIPMPSTVPPHRDSPTRDSHWQKVNKEGCHCVHYTMTQVLTCSLSQIFFFGLRSSTVSVLTPSDTLSINTRSPGTAPSAGSNNSMLDGQSLWPTQQAHTDLWEHDMFDKEDHELP